MHPLPPLCQGSQTMVPPRLICHEPALGGGGSIVRNQGLLGFT